MKKRKAGLSEQLDGYGSMKWGKQKANRRERRRARKDPECMPCHRKYNGYIS